MIQVHLTELFARPELYHSPAGRISLFLGGPPVAPLFMLVLGYFVAASRRSAAQLLARGGLLLLVALLLNIGLNGHLLLKIRSGVFQLNPWNYVLGVDILFLASFGILVLAVLRPVLNRFRLLPLALALLIAFTTPRLNGPLTIESPMRYALAFVGGNYQWSYFPLFPWLAYPLAGYAFFHFWQRRLLRRWNSAWHWTLLAVSGITVVLTMPYGIGVASQLVDYYHHGGTFFLWTLLFLTFWMLAMSVLDTHAGQTAPLRFVKWLGRNVTIVYILQWLMIGNLGTWLFQTQSPQQLVLWYLAILTTVSGLTLVARSLISQPKNSLAP